MRLQPQIKNNFGLLQYNFYEDKEQRRQNAAHSHLNISAVLFK